MKKLKVLVTCGATWSPIDDVRVISNVSTGEMGHLIARAFRKFGDEVTVIEGPVTHTLTDPAVKIIKYRYFDELAAVLKKELSKKYHIVVHAAAVSDFKVKRVAQNKLSSDKALTLKLTPTVKLINSIRRLHPECLLVGFKLEPQLNPKTIFAKVRPLFTKAGCVLVVANSLKKGYEGFIINPQGAIIQKAKSKQEIARSIAMLRSLRLSPDVSI